MVSDSARNFFEFFDLLPGFEIDLDALTTRYRELQRTVHPDRFAQASAQERRLAVQTAANINDAFRTLKDPVERALYLLRLKGQAVDDAVARQLDPEFLMEQIELREALAEARSSPQAAVELTRILALIDRHEMQILDALRAAFRQEGEAALQQANQAVQKLRFMKRLRSEAQEFEEKISGY